MDVCSVSFDSDHSINLFVKFADDTIVVSFIANNDETNNKTEVSQVATQSSINNLSLVLFINVCITRGGQFV